MFQLCEVYSFGRVFEVDSGFYFSRDVDECGDIWALTQFGHNYGNSINWNDFLVVHVSSFRARVLNKSPFFRPSTAAPMVNIKWYDLTDTEIHNRGVIKCGYLHSFNLEPAWRGLFDVAVDRFISKLVGV